MEQSSCCQSFFLIKRALSKSYQTIVYLRTIKKKFTKLSFFRSPSLCTLEHQWVEPRGKDNLRRVSYRSGKAPWEEQAKSPLKASMWWEILIDKDESNLRFFHCLPALEGMFIYSHQSIFGFLVPELGGPCLTRKLAFVCAVFGSQQGVRHTTNVSLRKPFLGWLFSS